MLHFTIAPVPPIASKAFYPYPLNFSVAQVSGPSLYAICKGLVTFLHSLLGHHLSNRLYAHDIALNPRLSISPFTSPSRGQALYNMIVELE
jgi:hypothetical protein